MSALSWPSQVELNGIKKIVSDMSGKGVEDVRVVISPYRICPLGAHIDHQGGTVLAMTIDKGILLGFVPSGDTRFHLLVGAALYVSKESLVLAEVRESGPVIAVL
uniref:Galactokinase N-terminal domain-containing protein n=1 Tax=Fagus sylvatica TaxID=28930 RepID=A0A2N9G3X3_FAGSY